MVAHNVVLCLCLQDEINTVPFFDVQLPRELALIIFGHLGMQDLGRCAVVSESLSLLLRSCTLGSEPASTSKTLPY